MKKGFIVLTVSLMMLFQGYGGVTQEEYDKIVAEKEKISKEMRAENEKLDKELKSVKADYEKVNKQKEILQEEKAKRVEAEVELSVPKAWATTYFGDNCIILAENKEYLQIVCKESYTVSLEGAQKIFDTLKQSILGYRWF